MNYYTFFRLKFSKLRTPLQFFAATKTPPKWREIDVLQSFCTIRVTVTVHLPWPLTYIGQRAIFKTIFRSPTLAAHLRWPNVRFHGKITGYWVENAFKMFKKYVLGRLSLTFESVFYTHLHWPLSYIGQIGIWKLRSPTLAGQGRWTVTVGQGILFWWKPIDRNGCDVKINPIFRSMTFFWQDDVRCIWWMDKK